MKNALTIKTRMTLLLLLGVAYMIGDVHSQAVEFPRFPKPHTRKTHVRIVGLAVTEGSEREVVHFFPDMWNPIDSLRFGLPKGITLMSSPDLPKRVCANGFKRYGLCLWECVLEIAPSSYTRLATAPKWYYSDSQEFVMTDGTKQVGLRMYLLADGIRFPTLEVTLQPRKLKGKEARGVRDLKSKL